MSSRRSRSRSPRERSDSPPPRLPGGAEPITEAEYFLKNAEFRVWLKDSKHKYFDELSGEKARKYFRKFVKDWNRGKLSKRLYAGVDSSAQSATAYKWSFTSSHSKSERQALDSMRADAQATARGVSSSGRVHGPTMPSTSDLTLAREATAEQAAAERELQRRRDKRDARDREEDMIGPRAVGRERMMEKKAEKRTNDRAFRERGDEGFMEADESTLMGGGSSFQQEIARRDAARKRFDEKRGIVHDDAARNERTVAMLEKEKATMDMFMQMAKEKFG